MNAYPKALIITVNFRHADCTLQLLDTASRLGAFHDCHLAIVDNDSGDDSAERIQTAASCFANVELMPSPENRGYFGAAKWALDRYLSSRPMPDWVVVCNNDIVFDSPTFFTELFAHDSRHVGVLAPAVISTLTGRDSNPMILHRPGKIRQLRYRLLVSTYYVAWLAQWLAPAVRKGRKRWPIRHAERAAKPTEVYAAHGSFLIFSRRYFAHGGVIDDGSFLYAEEIGVAETCRRLDLPIIHDPALRVTHSDSQTTGRILTRKTYELQKQGLQYALYKYLEPSRGA